MDTLWLHKLRATASYFQLLIVQLKMILFGIAIINMCEV